VARACLKCGHENPDDVDFCEQCGEYVRWELSGIRQAVPAPPPPPPAPPAQTPQPEAPVAAPPPPAEAPPPPPPQAAPPPVEPAPAPPPEVAPPAAADGGSYAYEQEPEPTSEYVEPEPEPEPDSAVITLRLPEDDSATGGEVTVRVEAGGVGQLVAAIRNNSGIVDNYDIAVEGLPEGWWSVSPSTVYLVPYGASGGEYEQEVFITLNPPRAAEAEARTWPVKIVAVSKALSARAGQAAANIDITPYHELEAEMRPERTSARRRAQFAIAVRNRANAPVDVMLAGVDPDNEMRFSFQKPRFTVAPGRRNGSAIMVLPPKPAWIGRPVQRRFEITSTVIGSETGALPKAAFLTQKPWIPAWALFLVPLLLIAALAAYLLWPRHSTVPELAGLEVIAAEQALADAGLVLGNQTQQPNDQAKVGTILEQSPASGEEVDDGSAVSVVVAVATGRAAVPDVIGKTLEQANELISKAGFTMAPPTPPPGKTDVVASQIPLAGNVELKTTPITLAFKPAPVKGGGGGPGVTTGGGGGGGDGGGGGTGEANIEVPDLEGVPKQEAFEQLTKLGLVPKVEEQASADAPAGELLHQDPEHGTKVKKGSEVTLVYSTGAPELVYDQAGNIFIAPAIEGAEARPLVNTEAVEEEPNINEAGTLVAFRKGTATAAQIFTIDPTKPLSLKAVTGEGFDDNRPAFSPDGKTIAFVRAKPGSADRDLCFVPSGGGNVSCIVDPNRSVTRPAWSPDGRVVFVVGKTATENQVELLRYATAKPNSANQADWTDQGYVTDSLHGQRANDFVYYAAYSRDGKQLAFTANWGKDFSHLYIAPIKDGVLGKPKEFVGVRACDVAWRPDGLELAVVQRGDNCESPQGQLVLIDPKKPSEQRSLRPGGSPSWAPGSSGPK
jgi:beta-lactam-binding protein with PASTA domain/Tol biopolymer transport system component